MDFKPFLAEHLLTEEYLDTALKWFTPLGDLIASHHDGAEKTLYIGVNGAQGSGKSTFSAFIAYYLEKQLGKTSAIISLDDFYLSQSERLSLSVKIHPLLKTRGVPGTHDVGLIEKTLLRLREYGTVSIPRFNKATDNPYPVTQWPIVNSPVDIVILEGWCWGVAPMNAEQLSKPTNALEAESDSLGIWRNYVNQQLSNEYQALQNMMDYWVMLKAPSFNCVEAWRIEQEHKLILKKKQQAQENGQEAELSGVMSDEQIRAFIMYFQRLTEHSLATLPEKADCVFELDADRRIVAAKGEWL
jgi:D-glycerate 3-kinase